MSFNNYNQNNSHNNNHNNDILFFKVWRNIYIKNIIIKFIHNQLYKTNYCKSYCTKYSLLTEKYKSYITKIIYTSNEELVPGDFEEGVQIINITNNIEGKLVPGVIPSTCKSLELREYNKSLEIGSIPFGVTKLSFGTYFTQSFESVGILPNSITELNFGGYFNSTLAEGIIPNSVIKLRINYKVQQGGYSKLLSKGSIPFDVKELVLNAQNILLTNESFPISITKLYIYGTLIKPIGENILPSSLTKLSVNKLKGSFIKGGIPNSVIKLSFKLFYEELIQPQIIPSSVTTLKVSNLICLTYGSIPTSVINLTLKDRIGVDKEYSLVRESRPSLSLFSKLTNSLFGNNTDSLETKYETIIPSSVQNLTYNMYRQLKMNEIPSSVTNLVLGPNFVYPVLLETIPSSIKTITIYKSKIKSNDNLHNKLPTTKIIYK